MENKELRKSILITTVLTKSEKRKILDQIEKEEKKGLFIKVNGNNLFDSFTWTNSEKGQNYWSEIHNSICEKQRRPNLII